MARLAIALAVSSVVALSACGGDDGEKSGTEKQGEKSAKQLFASSCASCHTLADADATGPIGPNLDALKPDAATVERQVTNGGGAMPSFKDRLSEAQIKAIAEYVARVAGSGG